MKQYLAVDSGGTKVLAILYDEAFHPIRSARAGSMRDNTTARDLVLRNADQLIDDLGIGGQTISLLTGVWDGGLSERLNARCTVEKSRGCGELDEGFYAGYHRKRLSCSFRYRCYTVCAV